MKRNYTRGQNMDNCLQPEFITIKFALGEDEYVRGIRTYLRKLGGVVRREVMMCALVVFTVVMSGMMQRLSVMNAVILALCMTISMCDSYAYWIKPWKSYRSDPSLKREMKIRVDKEGMVIHDEDGAGSYEWRVLTFWKTKEFYILSEGKYGWNMIPRRGFQCIEDEASFERFVMEGNPYAIFKNKTKKEN